jgi:hypothetical protein
MAKPLISVIVPIGQGEACWQELLPRLRGLPVGSEIICSIADADQEALALVAAPYFSIFAKSHLTLRWVSGHIGRAQQMNRAATMAEGEFLWFLHADSVFSEDAFQALLRALKEKPRALHYFRLGFSASVAPLLKWNAAGANFRSSVLKIPFGDQGFCIARDLFLQLGSFRTDAAYGEDHLFTWMARQNGVALSEVDACILTSARKYERNGWLKTTLTHLVLTVKQALPESFKLFKIRWLGQGLK